MRWAAVLTLAAISGCSDPAGFIALFNHDDHKLTVNVWNQGTQQVRVVMDIRDFGGDRRTEDFLLGPGGSAGFDYKGVSRLKVVAWRTSDSVVVFAETWDSDELNRHENVFLFP